MKCHHKILSMLVNFINYTYVVISSKSINRFSVTLLLGDIFCNAWSLITKICNVNWNRINYISTNYKHPNHFHITPLKIMLTGIKRNLVFHKKKTE